MFTHNFESISGPFEGFEHALTVHPVKQTHAMYKLHSHISVENILRQKKRLVRLTQIIASIDDQLSRTKQNVERVKNKNQHVERVKNKNQNVERVKNKNQNVERVKNDNQNVERVKNDNQNVERVKNKNQHVGRVNNKNQNVERVENKNQNVERVKNKNQIVERVNNKNQNVERVQNKNKNVERDQNKNQHVERVQNEKQNVERAQNNKNDKRVNNKNTKPEKVKNKNKNTIRVSHTNPKSKTSQHRNRRSIRANRVIRSNKKGKIFNRSIQRVKGSNQNADGINSMNQNLRQINHVNLVNKRGKGSTKDIDVYSTNGAWDFIKRRLVYSYTDSHRAPYGKIATKGRELGLTAAIASLNDMGHGANEPLFSYSKLTIGSGLEYFLIVQHKKSMIRQYFTLQRFEAPEIAEALTEIPENATEISDQTTKLTEDATKTAENASEFGHQRGVIYVILPLYKRSKMFAHFLHWLNISVSDYHSDVVLRAVIYTDKECEHLISQKYVHGALNTISKKLHIKIIKEVGRFARAKAISRGLQEVPSDGLVLVMDVDIRITANFLNKVYLNTRLGAQVFFPITFTQFDPHVLCRGKPSCSARRTDFAFDEDYGMWRSFGYGIVGVYKHDVTNVGGFNTNIKGWGKEDCDFFEKCMKHGLLIFRSPEPGLLHVHHERICDSKLPRDQFVMCLRSSESLYGSQSTLTNILLNNSDVKQNSKGLLAKR